MYYTAHHNNGGEIVPLVEYLVRRSSGRYQASDPSWYRRSEKFIRKFGRAMVTDSMGHVFRTGGLPREQQDGHYQYQSLEAQERYHRRQQQEQSLSPSILPSPTTIQDHPPPDVLPYPTDLTFQSQSMNTTDDEEKKLCRRKLH